MTGAALRSTPRSRRRIHRLDDRGPFDIVGDVHGCQDELLELGKLLGYRVALVDGVQVLEPPPGRRLLFIGDLADRGPKIIESLALAMTMVSGGWALCLPGNHDVELLAYLRGAPVRIDAGLRSTIDALAAEREPFRVAVRRFLRGLVSHYVLDGGSLVVAHAGLPEEFHGRATRTTRVLATWGRVLGPDEFGLPVRDDWASRYRGRARVVYGHTPLREARWVNRTINIDTGCVFGGRLTALRYPELELVSVSARTTYYRSPKPL